MEPIAQYTERLLEVRRHFTLHKDRVVVEAHWWLKDRYETEVKLNTLSGQMRELVIRYRMFRYAGWVMALGLLCFAIIYYNAKGAPVGILGTIALGAAAFGGAVMAVTYSNRRIRFARFDAKSGRGGLDIGQAGNSPEHFKSFVDKVKRQINKA